MASFFKKTNRNFSDKKIYLFVFLFIIIGTISGCLFSSSTHFCQVQKTPAFLPALISSAIIPVSVLLFSYFSFGQYLFLTVFFFHGFISGIFLYSEYSCGTSFYIFFYREVFILIASFLSVYFFNIYPYVMHDSDHCHRVFPAFVISMLLVIGSTPFLFNF